MSKLKQMDAYQTEALCPKFYQQGTCSPVHQGGTPSCLPG